ncbi:MAG: hypothetical protein RMM31_00735 [Anaerolineae bacterium]|nr:hypothetical protein [Thermoflexales bacterium]MDW8394750.1 hypothetical protein [Anaerolineae bacterium]
MVHFTTPEHIFALHPLPDGKCIAATSQGVWQLEPFDRWTELALGQVALTALTASAGRLIVGSSSDIALSDDGGATWQLARIPIQGQIAALRASPTFAQDGVALAATAADGVWRTTTRGASWFAWNHGLIDLRVNDVAFSPRFAEDEIALAATESGLFISYNGGRAWRELMTPAGSTPFTCVAVEESALHAFAGTEDGLWVAEPPFEQWQLELAGSAINALALPYAATSDGIFIRCDGRWSPVSSISDGVCLAVLPTVLVVGTAGDGVWVLAQ